MYKQVIVVNKGLNMSHGKLGAMVAHGSVAYFCKWFKQNVATSNETYNDYLIKPTARIDKELYAQWIAGDFTKIILEVENTEKMKELVKAAQDYGFENDKDFFNIVDESTEFLGVPQWAVIAFKPMDAEKIDPVTGKLDLYSVDKQCSSDQPVDEDLPETYKVTYYKTNLETKVPEVKHSIMMLTDCTLKSTRREYPSRYKWTDLIRKTVVPMSFPSKKDAVNWLKKYRGFIEVKPFDENKISILS